MPCYKQELIVIYVNKCYNIRALKKFKWGENNE